MNIKRKALGMGLVLIIAVTVFTVILKKPEQTTKSSKQNKEEIKYLKEKLAQQEKLINSLENQLVSKNNKATEIQQEKERQEKQINRFKHRAEIEKRKESKLESSKKERTEEKEVKKYDMNSITKNNHKKMINTEYADVFLELDLTKEQTRDISSSLVEEIQEMTQYTMMLSDENISDEEIIAKQDILLEELEKNNERYWVIISMKTL